MATALRVQLSLSLEGYYYETDTLAPGSQHANSPYIVTYTTGTGTNQGNVLIKRKNLSGAINLTSITDFLGTSRTLAQVSVFQVVNNDVAGDITIIGDFLPVLGLTGPFTVKHGGAVVLSARVSGQKYAVSAGSADDLTFSATSTDYDLLIVGQT